MSDKYIIVIIGGVVFLIYFHHHYLYYLCSDTQPPTIQCPNNLNLVADKDKTLAKASRTASGVRQVHSLSYWCCISYSFSLSLSILPVSRHPASHHPMPEQPEPGGGQRQNISSGQLDRPQGVRQQWCTAHTGHQHGQQQRAERGLLHRHRHRL